VWDVVPSASRETVERAVMLSRGAENGVEDTGKEDGVSRSWVCKWEERDVEYAMEESVGWKIVEVNA
jgi:hypothetical protein